MTFLYGDGTASNLEIDYIAFLNDAIDLAVAVLLADKGVRQAATQKERRRLATEEELVNLKTVNESLAQILSSADQLLSATTREAAGKIRKSTEEVMQDSVVAIKKQLASELGKLDNKSTVERAAIANALEKFLARNDLPDTHHRYLIKFSPTGPMAQLSGHAGSKVDWMMRVEVPKDNLLAAPFRLERIADGLEIEVPELAGLVKKSIKLKPYKLANKWVSEFSQAGKEGHIKVRTSLDDASSEGLDIVVGPSGKLQVTRIGKDASDPFEPSAEDAAKLQRVTSELSKAATALRKQRGPLVSVTLDGKTFNDHEDPTVLCQRLVARMAPIVSEIATRSMSRTELVLKREMSDNRREEIFCSKNDLRKKIALAPVETRGVFVPLGLADAVVPPSTEPEATEPEPPALLIEISDSEITNVQPASQTRPRIATTRPPDPKP